MASSRSIRSHSRSTSLLSRKRSTFAPASSTLRPDKRPIKSYQSLQPPQQKWRKIVAIKIHPIPTPMQIEESPAEIPLADTLAKNRVDPISAEASASASLPVFELADPLAIFLQDLAASSPKSNEEEDLSTITSAKTQQKLDKYLRLYSSGLPSLAQNMEQFDRLGTLLLDLIDQPAFLLQINVSLRLYLLVSLLS
uniref:Uncharacterized protein n=1 Tax=Ananas comosus var. bracteatus TaxID=296719 RepID=A0A6V7P5I2_ANACO|nr:unnamed protein product [Ananas comosus var. bracteatus]